MKKGNFTAHSWFANDVEVRPKVNASTQSVKKYTLPNFAPKRFNSFSDFEVNSHQTLLNYVNKDRLRDFLPSKNTYILGQALKVLSEDVIKKLKTTRFPKKILSKFYEDFISYCERKAIHVPVSDEESLWLEFTKGNSKFEKELNSFFDEYSLKTGVFFLSKLRLIKTLNDQDLERNFHFEILSPQNIFMKYFKKDSSQQLEGSFLLSNQYSWYAPSKDLINPLVEYFEIANSLSFIDFYQVLSSKVKYLRDISGDLAHRNFGLLLNSILHNFFLWKSKKQINENDLQILSCKYLGDSVLELSLSHWLAQYNNSSFKWDLLLSPVFCDSKNEHEQFFQLINEIEYYTFLAKISPFYDQTPFSFISKCSKEFKYNRKAGSWVEKDILSKSTRVENSKYDKLVVCVNHLPAKNAHHYNLQQVIEASKDLKEDGHIVLLSNQKIFVHSQAKRVQSFLNKFSVEAFYNFSDLTDKGNIPHYVYIISKKVRLNNEQQNSHSREECFHFRFSGKLNNYESLSEIIEEVNNFFNESFVKKPNFYRKDIGQDSSFEFFQDVIINGELIQSSTSDTGQITHPQFFKNLVSKCIPLSQFFDIQAMDIEKVVQGRVDYSFQMDFTDSLMSEDLSLSKNQSDLALILNFKDPSHVFLEICSVDLLESKSYSYGITSCYYYYLIPKFLHLNVNLFREFFFSSIGKQITQISFSGTYHQAKAKLAGLLVPKFFGDTKDMPSHVDHLNFMLLNETDLYNSELSKLKQDYKSSLRVFDQLIDQGYKYPCLSYLSYFKASIYNCLQRNKRDQLNVKDFDFNNEEVKQLLLRFDKRAIYPNNKNVFIEHSFGMKELQSELEDINFQVNDNEVKISLISDGKKIVTLHTDLYSGAFLNFILPFTKGNPIINVLKNLEIPDSTNLQSLIEGYLDKFRTLEEMFSLVSKHVDSLLLRSMNQ